MKKMMCFRRVAAPLCRNAAAVRVASARRAGVCRLEPASWRHRHTPVSDCAWVKQPQVSGSCLLRLKGTNSRVVLPAGIHQVKPTGPVHLHHGGHQRSGTSFRSLLSPTVRGLCSGKREEKPDEPQMEERSDVSAVPEHGLKFKELVRVKVF